MSTFGGGFDFTTKNVDEKPEFTFKSEKIEFRKAPLLLDVKHDERNEDFKNLVEEDPTKSFVLPNLTLILPKPCEGKDDDESQSKLLVEERSPDGNKIPCAKSLGELLNESEGLPDTILVDDSVEGQTSVVLEQDTVKNGISHDDVDDHLTTLERTNTETKIENTNIDKSQDIFSNNSISGVSLLSSTPNENHKVKIEDELDPKRNDESSVTSSRDSFQLLYSGKNKKLNVKQNSEESDEVKNENIPTETESESMQLHFSESQIFVNSQLTKDNSQSNEEKASQIYENILSENSLSTKSDTDELSNINKSSNVEEAPCDTETTTSHNSENAEISEHGGKSQEDSGILKATQHESNSCDCAKKYDQKFTLIKDHVHSICNKLSHFLRLKNKNENILSGCVTILKEIDTIIGGDPLVIEEVTQLSEDVDNKKKTTKRKSKELKQSKKDDLAEKVPKNSEESVPSSSDNIIKSKHGLAVFAKWPNSGWYYPGIVEGMNNNTLKDSNNVSVCFYDGLQRDMKNINVLPAHLIPSGSLLSNLEDETEMTVVACDRESEDSVNFTLTKVGKQEDVLQLDFKKLAIKALHMKSIKQQLEQLNMDVIPKNTHNVSLDNLVCGRRFRGRSLTAPPVTEVGSEKEEVGKTKSEEVEDSVEHPNTPSTTLRSTVKRRPTSTIKSTPSKRRTSSRQSSKN